MAKDLLNPSLGSLYKRNGTEYIFLTEKTDKALTFQRLDNDMNPIIVPYHPSPADNQRISIDDPSTNELTAEFWFDFKQLQLGEQVQIQMENNTTIAYALMEGHYGNDRDKVILKFNVDSNVEAIRESGLNLRKVFDLRRIFGTRSGIDLLAVDSTPPKVDKSTPLPAESVQSPNVSESASSASSALSSSALSSSALSSASGLLSIESLSPIITSKEENTIVTYNNFEQQLNDFENYELNRLADSVETSLKIKTDRNLFRQLMDSFSTPVPTGTVGKEIFFNNKPLATVLSTFDKKVPWVLPVCNNPRVIYDDGLAVTADNEARTADEGLNVQYKQQYTTLQEELATSRPFTRFLNPVVTVTLSDNLHANASTIALLARDSEGNRTDYLSEAFGLKNTSDDYPQLISNAANVTLVFAPAVLGGISGSRNKLPISIVPGDTPSLTALLVLKEEALALTQPSLPNTTILSKAYLAEHVWRYSPLVRNTVARGQTNSFFQKRYNLPAQVRLTPETYAEFLKTLVWLPHKWIQFIAQRTSFPLYTIQDAITLLETFYIYSDNLTEQNYNELYQALVQRHVDTFKKGVEATVQKWNQIQSIRRSRQTISILAQVPQQAILRNHEYLTRLRKTIAAAYDEKLNRYSITELIALSERDDYGIVLNMLQLAKDGTKVVLHKRLMAPSSTRTAPKPKNQNTSAKATDLNCAKEIKIIAKRYSTKAELEADNTGPGDQTLYFDTFYDPTNYELAKTDDLTTIISDIATPRATKIAAIATVVQKKNKKMFNVVLDQKDATLEAAALLDGRRRVEDGYYAILPRADNEIGQEYYVRSNGVWRFTNALDVHADSPEMLCALSEKCIIAPSLVKDKEAEEDPLNRSGWRVTPPKKCVRISDDLVSQHTSVQMENEYTLEEENRENRSDTEMYSEAVARRKKGVQLALLQELQFNDKYALLAIQTELLPYGLNLSPLINELTDIFNNNNPWLQAKRITEFVKNNEVHVGFNSKAQNENENYYYCSQSGQQLEDLPVFIHKLAVAFLKGRETYADVLHRLKDTEGNKQDDKWIHTKTGKEIAEVVSVFTQEFDANGFPVGSGHVVEDAGDYGSNEYGNGNGNDGLGNDTRETANEDDALANENVEERAGAGAGAGADAGTDAGADEERERVSLSNAAAAAKAQEERVQLLNVYLTRNMTKEYVAAQTEQKELQEVIPQFKKSVAEVVTRIAAYFSNNTYSLLVAGILTDNIPTITLQVAQLEIYLYKNKIKKNITSWKNRLMIEAIMLIVLFIQVQTPTTELVKLNFIVVPTITDHNMLNFQTYAVGVDKIIHIAQSQALVADFKTTRSAVLQMCVNKHQTNDTQPLWCNVLPNLLKALLIKWTSYIEYVNSVPNTQFVRNWNMFLPPPILRYKNIADWPEPTLQQLSPSSPPARLSGMAKQTSSAMVLTRLNHLTVNIIKAIQTDTKVLTSTGTDTGSIPYITRPVFAGSCAFGPVMIANMADFTTITATSQVFLKTKLQMINTLAVALEMSRRRNQTPYIEDTRLTNVNSVQRSQYSPFTIFQAVVVLCQLRRNDTVPPLYLKKNKQAIVICKNNPIKSIRNNKNIPTAELYSIVTQQQENLDLFTEEDLTTLLDLRNKSNSQVKDYEPMLTRKSILQQFSDRNTKFIDMVKVQVKKGTRGMEVEGNTSADLLIPLFSCFVNVKDNVKDNVNDNLQKALVAIENAYKTKKTIAENKAIDTILQFPIRSTQLTDEQYTDMQTQYIQYMKEAIKSLCVIFPTLVKDKPQPTKIKRIRFQKYWNLNPTENLHLNDKIQNFYSDLRHVSVAGQPTTSNVKQGLQVYMARAQVLSAFAEAIPTLLFGNDIKQLIQLYQQVFKLAVVEFYSVMTQPSDADKKRFNAILVTVLATVNQMRNIQTYSSIADAMHQQRRRQLAKLLQRKKIMKEELRKTDTLTGNTLKRRLGLVKNAHRFDRLGEEEVNMDLMDADVDADVDEDVDAEADDAGDLELVGEEAEAEGSTVDET